MAAIFPQVNRDAIGTGLFGHEGGLYRIRILGAAGITQGGDMVDVHTQVDLAHCLLLDTGHLLTVWLAADPQPLISVCRLVGSISAA
ncbi:hypothetical protein D3C80_1716260 [compost metagenome]